MSATVCEKALDFAVVIGVSASVHVRLSYGQAFQYPRDTGPAHAISYERLTEDCCVNSFVIVGFPLHCDIVGW